MSATLSILGLYNFNPSVFDDLRIPAEMENDKENLINNLLMECAEFEVLYTDPEFMQSAIGQWSTMMLPVWEKLYATTQFEYDPIYNYDRTEDYTDTDTRKVEYSRSPNLTEETTHGKTETQQQNSYENAGFVDALKVADGGTDTVRNTGIERNDEQHSGSIIHHARLYGNIGVTTTQQMIEAERDVVTFNMIHRIITDFQDRFCIMIY